MQTYQSETKFPVGDGRFDQKMSWDVEYQVEDLFLRIPKTFTIMIRMDKRVSHITKKTINFSSQIWLSWRMGTTFLS